MSGILANTTATILDKLKGAAADPDRIGEEHMPESFGVVSFVLGDTSPDIRAANSLGLGQGGKPSLHDGATEGGIPLEGYVLQGCGFVDVVAAATADQFSELARVWLPQDAWQASASLSCDGYIMGEVIVRPNITNWTGAENPKIGFYVPGSTQTGNKRNIYLTFDPTVPTTIFEFALPVSITGTTLPYLAASSAGLYGCIRKREISSGLVETITQLEGMTAFGLGTTRGAAATNGHVPVACYLSIPVDSSGADSIGTIDATCNLRLIKNSF